MRENVWEKNLKKKQPTLITTLPGTPSLPSSWPPLPG